VIISIIREISFSLLASEAFISWGEESNMHRLMVDACKRAGFSPRVAVETGDKACYERLISSGVGIGLGRGDEPPSGCAYLPVSDFDERYTVYVYYKPDARFGNVALFLNFLRNRAKTP
jgi:DNA-binding transcriptional LysR family regulator